MMKKKLHYIEKRISEGEHLNQDFKYEINDSRKIARSLVAFANTEGGRLLIGVKDNGKITGIKTDEEFYMIEAAANLYSKPPVKFERNDWLVGDKRVLEIIIPEGNIKPYLAQNEENKWKAYIRVADEIVLANIVHLKVWKKQTSKQGVFFKNTKNINSLLKQLESDKQITVKEYCNKTKTSYQETIELFSDLVVIDVLEIKYHINNFIFTKKKPST